MFKDPDILYTVKYGGEGGEGVIWWLLVHAEGVGGHRGSKQKQRALQKGSNCLIRYDIVVLWQYRDLMVWEQIYAVKIADLSVFYQEESPPL